MREHRRIRLLGDRIIIAVPPQTDATRHHRDILVWLHRRNRPAWLRLHISLRGDRPSEEWRT